MSQNKKIIKFLHIVTNNNNILMIHIHFSINMKLNPQVI